MNVGYDDKGNQTALWSALGGGLSKIVAFTATYPYQVIKSRLQQGQSLQLNAVAGKDEYTGTIDCMRRVYRYSMNCRFLKGCHSLKKFFRAEGIRAFFRGILPGTIKVVPSASLTFLVYEKTLQFLS
jgi:solute carrier family 25 folate transporter 32